MAQPGQMAQQGDTQHYGQERFPVGQVEIGCSSPNQVHEATGVDFIWCNLPV